jgi:hypothetical protein
MKILRLTEAELTRLIHKVINEQSMNYNVNLPHTRRNPLKPNNDPYLYAYEGNENFYVAKKTTPNMWKIVSDETAKNAIKDKHFFELGYKPKKDLINKSLGYFDFRTVLPNVFQNLHSRKLSESDISPTLQRTIFKLIKIAESKKRKYVEYEDYGENIKNYLISKNFSKTYGGIRSVAGDNMWIIGTLLGQFNFTQVKPNVYKISDRYDFNKSVEYDKIPNFDQHINNLRKTTKVTEQSQYIAVNLAQYFDTSYKLTRFLSYVNMGADDKNYVPNLLTLVIDGNKLFQKPPQNWQTKVSYRQPGEM